MSDFTTKHTLHVMESMNKNYNIYRPKLLLPEYGRHIHEMVGELKKISDRDERNSRARTLIAIMGNIQTHLRDTPDFECKLWDNLFIMADFDLDVDSPYPIPTAATLMPAPHKMDYPHGGIVMKHYGKNVRNVIRALERLRDRETVDAVISNLARYMRTKSYEYNQEHPDNTVIIKDIKRLSENGISVDEEAITHIKSEYKQTFSGYGRKNNYQKKNNKNQKNNRGRNYSK